MSVKFKRKEYIDAEPDWTLVRDLVEGERAVKEKKEIYLPLFVPHDQARYDAYLLRASLLGVTGTTEEGLVGSIFRKDPKVEVPAELEYIEENADGKGQGIIQVSKLACSENMITGRFGILTDFPRTTGPRTKEEDNNLNLTATMTVFSAENIINWRTEVRNGKAVTVLIVLIENITLVEKTFNVTESYQYRVLQLDNSGKYFQEIWNRDLQRVGPRFYPLKYDGSTWDKVPFEICGSKTNTFDINKSPLYDMAKINIAHYRNSADYEEGIYIHGQGTLFLSSDISVQEFKDANPNGITVGTRRGHFLGVNGNAQLLQMDANNAAEQAMLNKEQQMIMIGARLVTTAGANETAEKARIDAARESSILNTLVGNSSDAIEGSLKNMAEFMGGDPEEVSFELNTEFFPHTMTAQEVLAFLQLADRGDVSQADIRTKLRKAEWIESDRTDEDIDEDAESIPPTDQNSNFGGTEA